MHTTLINRPASAQQQSKPLTTFKAIAFALALLLWAGVLQAQFRLVGLTSTGGTKGGGTAFSMLSNGTSFSVANAFSYNGGRNPYAGLVEGTDGFFYGMMSEGGTSSDGTIFKMNASGTITVLKNLDYYVTGARPHGNLIQATDGNFYGLTYQGGRHGSGTIFKITSAGMLTVLRHLHSDTTGIYPQGDLVQATDGNLYGMTSRGGTNEYGTAFKITPGGTFTLLKSFDGTTGRYPYGGFLQGTDGAFYGMTSEGGANSYGTIFKMTTGGTLTILKSLDNTSGRYPYGSLTKGSDGAFYGMTNSGGTNGYGTIFRITSSGSFSVKKALDGAATGSYPEGNLKLGTDGLLYGMAYRGGAYNYGTIFKISTGGTFTKLEDLVGGTNSGAYPARGSLVQETDGVFYGMTYQGGTANQGTIFKVTSGGTFSLLVRLSEDQQGYSPYESLVQASDGYYYGTAREGGRYNGGVGYRLCTTGSYTVLRSFDENTTGRYPEGRLTQAKDGNFYGTTYAGGGNNSGTIFKLTSDGTTTVLIELDEATGQYPVGSLIYSDDTTLYGMAYRGGTSDRGTIFKITTSGQLTVLKNLDATTGYYPYGGLVKGTDGSYYGVTSDGGASNGGTVFKITSGGTLTVLENLAYAGGYHPRGNLIQGSDGNLYGMANSGGTSGYGVVFKVSTGGTYTVLKNFDYTTTGGYPEGSLVQGSDNVLYGMTSRGGTNDGGTIFKIQTSGGSFAVLRHFNPLTDGARPFGALVIQKSPSASSQSVTTVEDSIRSIILSGSPGTFMSYSITTGPKNGTLTGTVPNLTYKPNANYNGKDSFYFNATWGCQTSGSAKVLITVSQVNDAPVLAAIGNKTIARGSKLSFTATATDVDAGQTKTFSLIGAPSGAAIGSGSGAFSWTPSASGTFVFKVRVTDNGSPAKYDEETITATVTGSTLTSITKNENGIGEQLEALSLTASPNPTRSYFTLLVKSSRNEAITLKITDALGRAIDVKTGLAPNRTITFGQNYRPGTYLVQAQQGNRMATVKVSKE